MSAIGGLLNRLFGHDVFISYSVKDRVWAESIHKLLQLGRLRVFRDDTGIHAGDRLERILDEVRRSTMLVILVSENSLQSPWVLRELQAYCARPREQWRIAPVFLSDRYPRELEQDFRVLADFHGVKLPLLSLSATEAAEDRRLLTELTSQFRASRKATRQRIAAICLAAAACVAFGFVIWKRQIDSRRDSFVRSAEVASANYRFDEAELNYAKAWQVSRDGSILSAYREARRRRVLENPQRMAVEREESIVAVEAAAGKPYVVLHSSKKGDALLVIRDGQRMTLAERCDVDPHVEVAGSLIVWTCGADLSAANLTDRIEGKNTVSLPIAPVAIRLRGNLLDLLFREGAATQVGTFEVPALKPRSLDLLRGASAGGETGFCPAVSGSLAWAVGAEGGKIVTRLWKDASANAEVSAVQPPRGPGGSGSEQASWISQVRVAPDCRRFFVDYALFTLEKKSSFETARLRLDSPRPIDWFDDNVETLAAAPDESGVEAIYLTGSKELRAFLLTSPVVIATQAVTLASGVKRMGSFASEPGTFWTYALQDATVSVFRNRILWARYKSEIGEPVRAVISRDGAWVAFEGESASVVWRRAGQWKGAAPDSPERIARELYGAK